jgi:glutaredoxin|tara:strand:- start:1824 stop:2081 length:258 start_codon:yes stop_codon:yes gene_type:complete
MKFRLYTKNDCPYCQAAISLLAENQKEFECYALDRQPKLLTEIKETYRWETVPIVVEITEGQEKFIGGYTDLKEYLNKGKQLLQG